MHFQEDEKPSERNLKIKTELFEEEDIEISEVKRIKLEPTELILKFEAPENETSISDCADAINEAENAKNEEEYAINEEENAINEEENAINEEESAINEEENVINEEEYAINEEEYAINEEENGIDEEENAINEEESAINYAANGNCVYIKVEKHQEESFLNEENSLETDNFEEERKDAEEETKDAEEDRKNANERKNTKEPTNNCRTNWIKNEEAQFEIKIEDIKQETDDVVKIDETLHLLEHLKGIKRALDASAKPRKKTSKAYGIEQAHVNDPASAPHKCPDCGLTFRAKTNLAKHMTLHENNREFVCKLCNADFKHKNHLRLHLADAHNIILGFNVDYADWRKECERIDRRQRADELKGGKRKRDERKDDDREGDEWDGDEREASSSGDPLGEEKVWQCGSCNVLFSTKKKFIDHESSNRHKCFKCHEEYTSNDGTIEHSAVLNRRNKLSCHICRAKFKTEADLKEHIQCWHVDKYTNKKRECRVCGFTNNSASVFRRHLKEHKSK